MSKSPQACCHSFDLPQCEIPVVKSPSLSWKLALFAMLTVSNASKINSGHFSANLLKILVKFDLSRVKPVSFSREACYTCDNCDTSLTCCLTQSFLRTLLCMAHCYQVICRGLEQSCVSFGHGSKHRDPERKAGMLGWLGWLWWLSSTHTCFFCVFDYVLDVPGLFPFWNNPPICRQRAQGHGLGTLVITHRRGGNGIQTDLGGLFTLLVRAWCNHLSRLWSHCDPLKAWSGVEKEWIPGWWINTYQY